MEFKAEKSQTALSATLHIARNRADKFCGASFRTGKPVTRVIDRAETELRDVSAIASRMNELKRTR